MVQNSEGKKESLQENESVFVGTSEEKGLESKKDLSLDGDLDEVVSKPINIDENSKKANGNQLKNEQHMSSAILDAHIKRIITRAVELKATEIHIDEFQGNARIRYRIEGKLAREYLKEEVRHDVLTKRIKVMSEFFMIDKQMIQKGDILYKLDSGEELSINVNSLPTFYGDLIVLKLANERKNYKIVDLGMTYEDIRTVGKILEKKKWISYCRRLSWKRKNNNDLCFVK